MFASDIAEFRSNVRKYWRDNVKTYFSKTEQNYNLDPKMNHRFLIAPFGGKNEPRLKNALVVNWTPYTGHITVKVAPIMVKATGAGSPQRPKRIGKPVRTMTRTYRSGQHAYDLIDILSKGTRDSPGRYVVAIDARVSNGIRKGTTGEQWVQWFSSFMLNVEEELGRLADKLEKKIENSLIEEFE